MVTVVDRLAPGHGASFGHAGGIAVTWVSPQGLPGLARHLPGWIIDPLGPVAVHWPYLPRLVPWFLRLRRHSTPSEIQRIGDALAALMEHAWPAWDRTLTEIGAHDLVRHDGALTAYRQRSRLDADLFPWEMRRSRGFVADVIDGAELREREPALSSDYTVGVIEPQAKWCVDPMAVIDAMVDRVRAEGGSVLNADVSTLVTDRDSVRSVRTSAGAIDPGDLVIAAGAWSHRLVAQLGHHVPLESERGYHVDLPAPGVKLAQILSLAPHKMVATPMAHGIRLSGTAEFAGVDAPPNYNRARALLEHASTALPGLGTDGHSEWAGDRPILPDSLPVVGRDPRYNNVYHAFGHSHIGFTLGPVTGEIIADLVAGRDPQVPADPYRIDRFSGRFWGR